MAGTTVVNQVTLGNSATDTQNFALKTNVDGSMKLARKSDGTGGDILTVDANGVVALPVGQLKFPATQNPSSNVNMLDDYKEGTFTPVLAQAGMTLTQNSVGNYTKIGNLVTVTVYITITSLSGIPSGAIGVSGLPYLSSVGFGSACREIVTNGFAWTIQGNAGLASFNLWRYDNSTTLVNGMSWLMTFSYQTA